MTEGYETLKELALDLRWSWNHSADILWSTLDPDLWALTHNPWIVLQTISKNRLQTALADPKFKHIVDTLMEARKEQAEATPWFQKTHPGSLSCVAYFSMEFMVSEALPIYSGGLGNVAGDQLKAASDLGVPVIGIGLLYSQGYFRQLIDKFGGQQAIFPYNEPGQLPISPLRKPNGEWLRLEVGLPGWSVWIRAWEVQVGRIKLYLLDTNDAANFPAHRGITSELYGGDPELRLKQEIILGIGGWKLIQALEIKPEVCHLNEGHAAFAILERARFYMEETGFSFETALTAVRPGIVFTTHTAVPAGFDRFDGSLIKQYLGSYVENQLKISCADFLALGSEDPDKGLFNMAHFAIRGSGAVNGVSKLHGTVSRHLFQSLFPLWPAEDVPVGAVTNGVHMPTWDSAESDALWTRYCGKARWLDTTAKLEEKIKLIPDKEIWDMRTRARKTLVEFARNRLIVQLEGRGVDWQDIERVKSYLNPNTLTLGFARRFATYKRPNLLLHDPDRLHRILMNEKYPVQLLLAGKAHPADVEGRALIWNWMQFILNIDDVRSHVMFLGDYDMHLTEHLVQGTDVWINTPRRPWEACGTSGMKVLVNGGLNLSSLDGWWAESWVPEVGWALGDCHARGDAQERDAADANALYDLLEQRIIPEFYERNQEGIPVAWIGKIRESMARLTPVFSANRSVREYIEDYYIPAARKFGDRIQGGAALAQEIVEWKRFVQEHWEQVQFGPLQIENQKLEVELFLGALKPESVRVELFANGTPPFEQEMKIVRQTENSYVYSASIPSGESPDRFTPRIFPFHPHVSVPLEILEIKWQK